MHAHASCQGPELKIVRLSTEAAPAANGSIEPEIIGRLYMNHRSDLERYLRRFVEEHDAKDIVQDLFLQLLHGHPGWIGLDNVRRFLFVAGRRRALDLIRKRDRCEICDPKDFVEIMPECKRGGEVPDWALYEWLAGNLGLELSRLLVWRLGGWDWVDGIGWKLLQNKRFRWRPSSDVSATQEKSCGWR
jgi:hypothetical protein